MTDDPIADMNHAAESLRIAKALNRLTERAANKLLNFMINCGQFKIIYREAHGEVPDWLAQIPDGEIIQVRDGEISVVARESYE